MEQADRANKTVRTDEADTLSVCLINDSFPPIVDGVANVVINYATSIAKQHGDVLVAAPAYPGAVDDYDFDVLRYPSFDAEKLGDYRAGFPFSVAAINDIGERHIDVIHAHCPATSVMLARTLRKTVDAPIILTYHTKYDIDIRNAVRSELIQNAAINLLIKNVEACDEVWTVSHGAGDNLRSLGYTGDLYVMDNGVDMERSHVDANEIDALRRKHGINGNTVLLFVGRLLWYKGIRLILDALVKLKERGESVTAVFVGDSAERDEIEAYAKSIGVFELCVFVGMIRDRQTLRVFYGMANAFLFPSTFDTNGLVVREAAACYTPSVMIEGSCAAESARNMENAILIDENADALFAAMEFICNNHDAARNIGEAAARELYLSWDDSVARAVERYHIVVDKYERGAYRDDIETAGDTFYNCLAWLCESIAAGDELKDKIRRRLFEEREEKRRLR